MPSISTLNILLTGSASGLISAFVQGKHAAGDFGESVSSSFERVTTILEGLGIALSVEGFTEFLKDADQRIVQVAHSAAELGVTTDALTRLQFAAKETGVDAEQLTSAFAKMENQIGKATTEGGKNAEAFQRLGLDVQKLSQESPDQAFKDIAQAISQLHSPFERTQAEIAIFGKSGAALGPLLSQGAEGIAKAGEEADKLGITLNSVDAQKVLDANNAVGQLGEVVEGVGNQILVQLAPTILSISERLKQWLEDGNVVQRGLQVAFKGIQDGAIGVNYVLKIGEALFDSFKVEAIGALTGVLFAFDKLEQFGGFVLHKLFGTKLDTSGIDAAVQDLEQQTKEAAEKAKQAWSDVFSKKPAQDAIDFLSKAGKDAADKAKGEINSQNSGTGNEAKLEKGKSLFGDLAKFAEEAWKKASKAIEDAAKKAEDYNKKLDQEAKEAIEKSLSPLQKEQEELKKLTELYQLGKLSKEQFDQAKAKVEKDFNKDINTTPKAAIAGSQEAFDLINEINGRNQGLNSKDAVPEKQLTEQQKTNTLLEEIKKAFTPSSGFGLARIGA